MDRRASEILETVKKEIAAEPKLIFPNFDEAFILEYDASDFGIGGVLF